jgi:predicted ATPase
MFTDMVGFTALMQSDELLARERREKYMRAVERNHEDFTGVIVQRLGDGTMSRFASSLNAVLAGVGIQRELVSEGVLVRVGVHVGEVVVDENDLIGDAVNIASRIESFAVAGGVMISDTVYENLRNRSDIDVVSMGRFRLKNVGRPFELLAVAAAGVVVPDPGALEGKGEHFASLPSNLPSPSTPLVGREDELLELEKHIRDNRVVTIIGPGGTGKTRLAVELGRRLAPQFLDGVSFVAMADVRDPTEFMPSIAASLDVKETDERTLAQGVADLIGDKRALLLLDNLEQLVTAAPDLTTLVARCSGLRIVATSRTPLRISAEQVYPLSTLSLPAPGTPVSATSVLEYSAVTFFIDRVRSAKSDFVLTNENVETVVKICQRLDGLPLALELAAPRLRLLSAQVLYERLGHALDTLESGTRDSPERHRTLRATIGWSYSLLEESEQRLFRRMSVFSGGCTITDLEAVASESGTSLLNDLQSLVDHALVQVNATVDRYTMLQTVSEFAAERLTSSDEEGDINFRHAQRYVAVTEELRDDMQGNRLIPALERGGLEEGNIMVALETLLTSTRAGDPAALELGLQACGNLGMYWHIRGKNVSAREQTMRFLVEDREKKVTVGRSSALITAGLALWITGDFDGAINECAEANQIANDLNAPRWQCMSLLILGLGFLGLGDESGRRFATEAVELCREAGFPWGEGYALSTEGMFLSVAGESNSAEERFASALLIFERLGDEEGKGLALGGLAALAAGRDAFDVALDLYRQSSEAFAACGDRAEEARVVAELAWSQLRQGSIGRAREYFLASVDAYTDVGSVRGVGIALTGLAAAAAAERKFEQAIQLASAAEVYAMEEGIVNVYSEETSGREFIEGARAALSVEEAARAAEVGRRLSIREAVALARSI